MNLTAKRTTIYLTQEANRQLEDLKQKFGENSSKAITRAIQLLYYSERFWNIDPREFLKKDDDDASAH